MLVLIINAQDMVLDLLTRNQIEEFHPQKSIVVTPAKMVTYYANHSLEREVYPLLCKSHTVHPAEAILIKS